MPETKCWAHEWGSRLPLGWAIQGRCAAGTRSLLTGYIPCQGGGHAHAAPYLPGCETIISEVGVMHDDRPRPLHPNAPCPSPECCRASTSAQLGTGEILPQQPFSLLLSLHRSVSQGKAMIHSPKVSPSLATNALKPIAAPAPSVRQCTPPAPLLQRPSLHPIDHLSFRIPRPRPFESFNWSGLSVRFLDDTGRAGHAEALWSISVRV